MQNEIKFKTLSELYERILPALKSKTKELNKKGMNYIHEEDIWNFLKNYKWTSSRDLDLSSIVNDVFNVDVKELDNYVKENIKDYRRDVNESEI